MNPIVIFKKSLILQQSDAVAVSGISFADDADDGRTVACQENRPVAAHLISDPRVRIGVGRVEAGALDALESRGKAVKEPSIINLSNDAVGPEPEAQASHSAPPLRWLGFRQRAASTNYRRRSSGVIHRPLVSRPGFGRCPSGVC